MKSKKAAYLGLTLLVIVSFFGVYLLSKKERLLRGAGKYTIAVVEKLEIGSKGIRVFLKYSYKDKKIESDFMAEYKDRDRLELGKRIFIKFIPPEYNLEYMDVKLDCMVPDSIIKLPPTGWTKEWMQKHFPECVNP